MSKFMNYLGQLRIYSLVDLVLLVVAFHLPARSLVGTVILWLGFISYLEYHHRHPYRFRFPFLVPMSLAVVGLWYFGIGGIVFLLWSVLYCKKNQNGWGLVSPIFRGLQTMTLVWNKGSWPTVLLSGLLVAVRNLLGDARDTSKDRKVGMKTWPVVLNWSDHKYLHLLAVMGTTAIWGFMADLNLGLVVGIWLIQIATYWLTPR